MLWVLMSTHNMFFFWEIRKHQYFLVEKAPYESYNNVPIWVRDAEVIQMTT